MKNNSHLKRKRTARALLMAYMLTLFLGAMPVAQAEQEGNTQEGFVENWTEGDPSTLEEDSSSQGEEDSAPEEGQGDSSAPDLTEGDPDTSTTEEDSTQSDEGEDDTQGDSSEEEDSEEESDEDVASIAAGGDGTLTIELPGDTSNTYTLTIEEFHYLDSTLVEKVTSSYTKNISVNGTTKAVEFVIQHDVDYTDPVYPVVRDYLGHTATIYGLKGGESIEISGIQFTDAYNKIVYTFGGLQDSTLKPIVYNSSTVFSATFNDPVISGQTLTTSLGSELTKDASRKTTSTFDNLNEGTVDDGQYSTLYFLNYYSILSFDDIESTHIIGSVVAQGSVARSGYSDGKTFLEALFISDYSQGCPSYIGEILPALGYAQKSAFLIQYGFDDFFGVADSNTPYFYTSSTDKNIIEYGDKDYVIGSDNLALLAPNNSGQQQRTLLAENFFDFSAMLAEAKTASAKLVSTGVLSGSSRSTEIVDIDLQSASSSDGYTYAAGVLTLDHGKSYSVKSSSASSDLLKIVIDYTATDSNFVYAVDKEKSAHNGLTQTSDNTPTTINLYDSALPKQSGYSIFPKTEYLDFTTGNTSTCPPTVNGEGNEYTTVGNKVIWNLVDTSKMTMYADNVLGHILAPETEIYSYGTTHTDSGGWSIDTSSWMGGNINGTVIAKTALLGDRELHFWPYMTNIEKSTTLSGVKTTDTGADVEGNVFYLTVTEPTDLAAVPDSYISTATSDSSGAFSFDGITFSSSGTYTYYAWEYEDPQNNSSFQQIFYDQSIYKIVFEVTGDSTLTVASTTITKKDGATYENYTGEKIAFHNTHAITELPETGGGGRAVYTVYGISLMALSFYIYQTNSRKKFN